MFPTTTPSPNRTITARPTLSPIPSITPTISPTLEPTPTNEPEQIFPSGPIATAREPLRLGSVTTLEEGGFSFRPPLRFEELYQFGQVTLTSNDKGTVLSLIGGQANRTDDLEGILIDFAEILSETFVEFNPGEPYPYSINGISGLASEVDGIWGESPISGRIAIVAPSEEQLFYTLAIAANTPNMNRWEPEGRQAFEAVMRTVIFFDPIDSQE
jgi:hypothetical protein